MLHQKDHLHQARESSRSLGTVMARFIQPGAAELQALDGAQFDLPRTASVRQRAKPVSLEKVVKPPKSSLSKRLGGVALAPVALSLGIAKIGFKKLDPPKHHTKINWSALPKAFSKENRRRSTTMTGITAAALILLTAHDTTSSSPSKSTPTSTVPCNGPDKSAVYIGDSRGTDGDDNSDIKLLAQTINHALHTNKSDEVSAGELQKDNPTLYDSHGDAIQFGSQCITYPALPTMITQPTH